MKDTINYVNRNIEKSQKQIHQMMEVLDLVDTYRELHPESKRYSWRPT
jgi:exonuclease III